MNREGKKGGKTLTEPQRFHSHMVVVGSKSPCKVRCSASGIHLFNRATGWNILIDEVRQPEHTWASAPRQVSIALTNACDLDCAYCFAPKMRSTLEFERVLAWIGELDLRGTLGVGFGGGEPTLYKQFVELCVHATKNTSLAVTFTTHGHHLNDQFLERLNGYVNFIRISMDGVNDTYERLRHRSFPALVGRLRAVKQITRFGINYVVNSDTFPDLDRAIELAEEVDASEFLLLPEQIANGRGGVSAGMMRELRAWIQGYRGLVPLAISERNAEGMPTSDPFPEEAGLREYAHIDAQGILKRTSFDKTGIAIDAHDIMSALRQLRQQTR